MVLPRDQDHKNNVFICMLLFSERKARVDAVWQQMNKGVSARTLYSIINKPSSASNKTSSKKSSKPPSSVSIRPLLYNRVRYAPVFIRTCGVTISAELDDSTGIVPKEDIRA